MQLWWLRHMEESTDSIRVSNPGIPMFTGLNKLSRKNLCRDSSHEGRLTALICEDSPAQVRGNSNIASVTPSSLVQCYCMICQANFPRSIKTVWVVFQGQTVLSPRFLHWTTVSHLLPRLILKLAFLANQREAVPPQYWSTQCSILCNPIPDRDRFRSTLIIFSWFIAIKPMICNQHIIVRSG